MESSNTITYFGETDFRNQRSRFGIKKTDRSRHVYVIGKTGMGKSTLLENMAAQDILNGEGMCFVDPHGSGIDNLLDYIPEHRIKDVIYFAPVDTEFPISFNVLESVEADKRHVVVSGLMAAFKKIWPDVFSGRMEYILSNTLLALLEYPNATLLGVNRMLSEKDYRDDVINHITDVSVRSFWVDEYNKWDVRYAREAGAAIQNKIGQFTTNPLIRNIIGQEKSTLDFRAIMDEKKILLVNLSKGLIGETNQHLLGGMLITKLYLAAMSRADVGAKNLFQLPNFFLFVDEFQNFANESFADILSEARKYKLNLTVAHQYIAQMDENVSAAIFGNVGTMITFRVGPTDAEFLEKQFAPTFSVEDIVNLGKYQIYLSLMIDGIGSRPFSARTMPPVPKEGPSLKEEIIKSSQRNFAQPRALVEARIEKWFEPIKKNIVKRAVGDKTFPEKDSPRKTEEEMKQIVSPKLNNLLDKIGGSHRKKDDSEKKIENKKPYKKESVIISSGTKASESNSKEKKIQTRSSSTETKNSLQDALKKALASKEEKTPRPLSSTNDNQKETKKDDTQKQEKPQTLDYEGEGASKKEVPEDILKNIFNI
ncbi:MAG: TraM recognition domain-containing protein [Candidatus Pacebacteria bacterium]|nr:TraM recognition domain-containing protein [Candidatus Paceibacterota bacterium]